MNDDSLWQNITMDAETYKNENEQAGIRDSASFEYGMRNHKPVLMELIKEMESESIMDEKKLKLLLKMDQGS